MFLTILEMGKDAFRPINLLIILATYAALIFVCLPVHELAHAFAAHKLGDDTAKWSGRLTLNPMKHLDTFGTIMMLLCGFGYARPVPVNPYYFKNRKSGMAITAFAGPLSNLMMAILAVGLYRVVLLISNDQLVQYYAGLILIVIFANINISLAVFNLLPIPPLDGSRIFSALLPDRVVYSMEQYQQYISIILMVLILSGALDMPLALLRHGFGAVICTLFGMENVF